MLKQSKMIQAFALGLAVTFFAIRTYIFSIEPIKIILPKDDNSISALLTAIERYEFHGFWQDKSQKINKTLASLSSFEGVSRMRVSVEKFDMYSLSYFSKLPMSSEPQFCFQFRFSSPEAPANFLHYIANIPQTDINDHFTIEKKISIKQSDRPKINCVTHLDIKIENEKFLQTNRLEDIAINFQMESSDPNCEMDLSVVYRYDDYHNNKEVFSFLIFSFLIATFDFVVILLAILQFDRFNYTCKSQSVVFWTGLAMFNCLFCFIHIYDATDNLDKVSFFFLNAVFNFVNFSLIILKVLHKIGKVQLIAVSNTDNPFAPRKYIAIFYLKVYIVILFGLIEGIQNCQNTILIYIASSLFYVQLFTLAQMNKRMFPSMVIHFSLTTSKLLFLLGFKKVSSDPRSSFDFFSTTSSIIILLSSLIIYTMQKEIGPRLVFSRMFGNSEQFDYFSANKKSLVDDDVCSICFSDIKTEVAVDWSVQMPDLSHSFQEFIKSKKQPLMMTPCNHLFHASCLLTFMSYKMSCPICRTDLPEID